MPETLHSVDDLLPVGVLRIGADRRVGRANAAAHVLLGIPAGRLVGRSLMEAFLDARLEAALDALEPGSHGTAEARVGPRSARTVSVKAARRDDGSLDIVIEDITELRRLRQIRTEFIDNLSHELRTPISTVSLLAETLALEAAAADVPDRIRERIARIEIETGHLGQMVGELLDLARIEGGTQMRLVDDIDLGGLAAAALERLRLFAEQQGVTLVAEVDPDLPHVVGDETRLGQVLANLVHNAVKFSPDGGEVRVTVGWASDPAFAQVAVTDHGIGIGRADRPRVFERFYKADRARVRGGGTGLGLAISRHIVEGHGGEISVESEEGIGSTFTFTVPFTQATVAPRS